VKNLSYRYKVPLSLSAVIVATAATVAAVLGWQTYRDLRSDLIAGAESLGRTLSRALTPSMLRDEVWAAYETIVTPLDAADRGPAAQRTITVLDSRGSVFVSSDPRRFPMLAPASALDPSLARLQDAAASPPGHGAVHLVVDAGRHVMVAVPILADDGARLGTVVLSYAESLFLPRLYATLGRVALSTLMVLAVLLPLGWYMGKRMAVPLSGLAQAMAKVGSAPRSELAGAVYRSDDEIGQLGQRFERMLEELEEKQELEKQMIVADRLAAIGRLTAGIAHEINNPLGGMMNAVNTFRHHGRGDPVALRAASLLERGLAQIRDTVGALLVEARVESHALTREDIEDIRILVQPQMEQRATQLEWTNAIEAPVALPSTPVRQILINLLLNAVQAAAERGRVRCAVSCEDASMIIDVRNGGKGITASRLERLFEPFAAAGEPAGGFGLWVTYQLVQQLGGTIEVTSANPETRFVVSLPAAAES
jgi:two-component system NtrC family sensor kinase